MEVGMCTWSIDRGDVVGAIRTAERDYGVGVVQVGVFDETTMGSADANAIRKAASEVGVEICGTFVGFEGVDRTSMASVERTGGLRPDDAFERRLALLERGGALTRSLGAGLVAAHLGAIAGRAGDGRFGLLVERVRRAADAAAAQGVTLLAETGQEPAEVLAEFLAAVNRPNVGVNFDPGNLVICGTGHPVKAVVALGDWIRLVHLKDAVKSSEPGVAWGSETGLGAGDANIPRVVSKLRSRGYRGPVLIERSLRAGETHRDDLAYARSMIC